MKLTFNFTRQSKQINIIKQFISFIYYNPPYSTQQRKEFERNLVFHRVLPFTETNFVHTEGLKTLRQATAIQSLLAKRQLVVLSQVFQDAHIPMLCLKGPVILEKAYGGKPLRIMRDLDLLIHPSHLEQAVLLLSQQGYRTDDVLDDESYFKKNHHFVFTHIETKQIVELHWRLFSNLITEPEFELLWETRDYIQIRDTSIACLNNEMLFVYLTVHGSKHAWFRLKWLVDLNQLLKQGLDWTVVARLVEGWEVEAMMGQTLLLLEELFQQEIPDALHPYMAHSNSRKLAHAALLIMGEQLSPEPETDLRAYLIWKRYHFLIRTPAERKKYLRAHFIPTSYDYQVIRLPRTLHFLYVPLRPLTVLIRRFQSQRGIKL